MRGQKQYNDVLKKETTKRGKGRNESLLTKRNNCLLARYYYYGHFREKCFEDILQLLAADFFLSNVRIIRLVQQNSEKIKELKDSEATIYQLQQSWPQFKW